MRFFLSILFLLIIVCLSASVTLYAQGASLPIATNAPSGIRDPLFGSGGSITAPYGIFNDMIVQPDGRVVVLETTPTMLLLHRYTAKGTIDESFGTTGVITITREISTTTQKVVQQPDGRLMVHINYPPPAGNSTAPIRPNHILRYTSDGATDTSWGGTGIITTTQLVQGTTDHIDKLQPLPDNSVLVASRILDNEPYTVTMALTRYTSIGDVDTTFHITGTTTFTVTRFVLGSPINPEVVDIHVNDGMIELLTAVHQMRFGVSGGYDLYTDCCYEHHFTTSGLQAAKAKIVINVAKMQALRRQPDQSILVLDGIAQRYGNLLRLMRYTPIKQLDATFNQGKPFEFGIRQSSFEFNHFGDIAPAPNGEIVVVGETSLGISSDIFVSRITAAGDFRQTTLDTKQPDERVVKAQVQVDGGVLLLTSTSLRRYVVSAVWFPHIQR